MRDYRNNDVDFVGTTGQYPQKNTAQMFTLEAFRALLEQGLAFRA